MAALLALGLMLGWAWVRYLTLFSLSSVGLSAVFIALSGADAPFRPGFLLLAASAWLAITLLAFPRPVRAYFGAGTEAKQ